jgi:hypothetical protein
MDTLAGKLNFATTACILLLVTGCATLPREPVPVDRVFDAEIAGMPDVRAWGGILSPDFQADFVESHHQEAESSGTDRSVPRRRLFSVN